MKDNKFVHETTKRFGDGLSKALAEGSDTFSFEFQLSELDLNNPATPETDATMTLMVLMRPKELADPMLEAMQAARAEIVRAASAVSTSKGNGEGI